MSANFKCGNFNVNGVMYQLNTNDEMGKKIDEEKNSINKSNGQFR